MARAIEAEHPDRPVSADLLRAQVRELASAFASERLLQEADRGVDTEPQNRVMRNRWRLLAGLGVTSAVVVAPAGTSLAAPASGTAVVKPVAEAWYRTTPACALAGGCGGAGAAPSAYAADTLHVGVLAGLEEARTYLQFDLTVLPSGTQPTGGTLLLPVATGGFDGTRAPDAATMQACAVKAPVKDVDGSFAAPPEVDCEAASAPAKFVPAAASEPPAFTVDLGALAAAWTTASPGAVVLLPTSDTAPLANWHVAFSDRTRKADGAVAISARLAITSDSVDTGGNETFVAPPPFDPALAVEPAPAFDSAAPALSAELPLLPAPVPQPQAAPVTGPAPATQPVTPVAATLPSGFRYPGVFLLPLLVAAAVAWLARALTRDLVAAA